MRFCAEGSCSAKAGKPAVRRWVMRVEYWDEGEKEPGTMRMVGFVVDILRMGLGGLLVVDGGGDNYEAWKEGGWVRVYICVLVQYVNSNWG
jgi:hypothetical protein